MEINHNQESMGTMENTQNILITGGTSGIGEALVKHFDRQAGYRVYFTARNEEKAKALAEGLQQSEYLLMDFSRLATVTEGARRLREQLPQLDILINNAGTWQMEFSETADGIETNFAVNHLAPMLLTLELLPALKKAPAARIIHTSSGAHRRDILELEDLEFRQGPYNGIATYSQSKLCNLLFSLELKNHLEGSRVTTNTVHPGYVQSGLFENMGPRNWETVPSSDHGARSAIYAATAPELAGLSGKYFYLEGEEQRLSPRAMDPQLARALWAASEGYLKPFLTEGSPS